MVKIMENPIKIGCFGGSNIFGNTTNIGISSPAAASDLDSMAEVDSEAASEEAAAAASVAVVEVVDEEEAAWREVFPPICRQKSIGR